MFAPNERKSSLKRFLGATKEPPIAFAFPVFLGATKEPPIAFAFPVFRRDEGAAYCIRFPVLFSGDIQPLMATPNFSIGF